MGQQRLARKTTRVLPGDFRLGCPQHAVGPRRGHPTEFVGVGRACGPRIVRAGFEYRAASRAVHIADALDEPARRHPRIGEHPQLAAPNSSAAQREEPVARAERRSHRVLDDPEHLAAASDEADGFARTPEG